MKSFDIDDFVVEGKFPKMMRLRDEFYEWVEKPDAVVTGVKASSSNADILTFVQRITDRTPKYHYPFELEGVAALPISSYDQWFSHQIYPVARNRIKKAIKSKVSTEVMTFDMNLLEQIKTIYDESPVRQGKPFRHYQKSIEVLMKETDTFRDRSVYIGAYYDSQLIGFAKLIRDDNIWGLSQIISMISYRDKAPTNALIAKAVEVCAQQGAEYLHYNNWSKGGLGAFKVHHAFQEFRVPRYFIPLNFRGWLAMRLKLHLPITELLPEKFIDLAIEYRGRFYEKIAARHESEKIEVRQTEGCSRYAPVATKSDAVSQCIICGGRKGNEICQTCNNKCDICQNCLDELIHLEADAEIQDSEFIPRSE